MDEPFHICNIIYLRDDKHSNSPKETNMQQRPNTKKFQYFHNVLPRIHYNHYHLQSICI